MCLHYQRPWSLPGGICTGRRLLGPTTYCTSYTDLGSPVPPRFAVVLQRREPHGCRPLPPSYSLVPWELPTNGRVPIRDAQTTSAATSARPGILCLDPVGLGRLRYCTPDSATAGRIRREAAPACTTTAHGPRRQAHYRPADANEALWKGNGPIETERSRRVWR
jgi:hypothetical protein